MSETSVMDSLVEDANREPKKKMTFAEIQREIVETLATYDDTIEQIDNPLEKSEFMIYMEKLLAGLGEQEADKIDGYGELITRLSAEEDRLKSVIDSLTQRRKSTQNKINNIRNFLLHQMVSSGLTKVSGNIYTARVNQSKSVDVYDIDVVPENYIRTEIAKEPDKTKIGNDLKANIAVPGCKLSKNQSVVIK